ncbi:hypothetical protein KP509_04G024100 [Ceratopteris richardii]|nr:hypothetical protein KP509_04G024100 [Ceratopteris richardii]
MNQSMRNSNSTTTTTTIDDNYNKNCHHHHCNTDNDDDDVEDDHIDDDDDDDDDDYDDSDCLIDMESNSKGWTMAWALAPSDVVLPITEDFNCSMLMRCNSSGNSCTSQKELSAAVLKKKYHKEFTEQQQAVVVSSHCEDNMHTFTFPNTYDYNLDGREKISNHVSTKSKTENQGCLITNDNESFGGLFQNSYYQHFAVEKKSQNPYVDFHNSMVEMVLHKQMHEATELEELLQLFLSLNSLEHHELIVQAFCDVWEKVFGRYMESTK